MDRHSLSLVNLRNSTAVCLKCGPVSLWIDPRRKRIPRCQIGHDAYLARQRARGERERRKVPRKFCRVISVDKNRLRGTCAKCGPVLVKPRQFGKYFTCINSWNATRALVCTSGAYGLTRKEAVDFVNRIGVCQNRKCKKVLDGPGNKSNQGHVDHDHATGEIRGVLCSSCNHALGMVRDNVEVLAGLVTYLKHPPGYDRELSR